MIYHKRLQKTNGKHGPAMNIMHYAESIDEAWMNWYDRISRMAGKETAESRDGCVVGEIINATTVLLDPTQNILKNEIRKLPMKYAIGELLWYLSGNPGLEAIRNYTSAWDRMSDNGVTVNSNYGYLIQNAFGFDQYEYVKELLLKDPNSRQAIIHIKTPIDTRMYPTKDLNCTIALQFFVRDGALHLTTFMRSNDLWMGFPNDIFQFTCIQIRMAMELGIDIGYYTHIAGSLHLYERDYKKSIENIIKNADSFVDGEPAVRIKETPEEIVGQDPVEAVGYKNRPGLSRIGIFQSHSSDGNPSI
jgi:thymidylate synthase